jgi:hypothetical protein
MSIKSRTIDNLGIESSVRYAKDIEQLDVRMLEESKWIPEKTTVSAFKPYVPSEFAHLFSFPQKALWAAFFPPPDYYDRVGRFFSYQLIPSLGSYEKQEADTDKIGGLEDALNKPFSRKKKGDQEGSEGQDQEQSGEQNPEEERERQVVMSLLETITRLDRALVLINSRRNQFQRG